MKAFALEELGKPGWVQELPVPEPIEGQVRVRVRVASLNPFDNAVVHGYLDGRMEHRFPLIPGLDASGTVDAVGADVKLAFRSIDSLGINLHDLVPPG